MKRCCVLAGALVLAACARPVPMERTLSHELLTNGGVLDAALELNEFAVPEDARVASNLFNARLILDTEEQDNDGIDYCA